MPYKARQLEKKILAAGWVLVRQTGSHRQYKNKLKPGLITIPIHPGDISKTVERIVLKQAGLK